MGPRQPRRLDAALPIVALTILVVTALLTYVGGVLESFRGSSFVYLGWALLAVCLVAGLAVLCGASRPAVVMLRNAAFVGGVVVIGFAIGLAVYADRMFAWFPRPD